jgi:hypothetical protein
MSIKANPLFSSHPQHCSKWIYELYEFNFNTLQYKKQQKIIDRYTVLKLAAAEAEMAVVVVVVEVVVIVVVVMVAVVRITTALVAKQ